MFNILVTRDELNVICNALNAEAKHFDNLAASVKPSTGSVDVYRRKASANRALTIKLLEQIS